MKRNSQLSGMLHVLLHMGERDGPMTSEVLAKAMRTNAVVIRRVLARLRERGYVRSERGPGGGWRLTRDLSQLTMRDVYDALGHAPLFALGNRTDEPGCAVEQSVNAALDRAFEDAQALLLERFGDVTLAMLGTDVRRRLAGRGGCRELEEHDAL